MKRMIAIMLALLLIATLSLTVHAVTPKLNINLPEIPDITNSVRENVRDGLPNMMLENWLREHPIHITVPKFDFNWIKLNLFR